MNTAKFCSFEVKRFRSLVDLKVDISDEMPVVICGENNIGKTNFLRALNIFFNHPFIENLYEPKVDIPHHIYEGSRGAGSKTELIGYFKDEIEFKLSATFKDDGDVEYKLRGKDASFEEVKNFLRVCKKICVNDILPMTYKGNYHGHTQQVCKRLSAITY